MINLSLINQIREIAYKILEQDHHPAHGIDHIKRVEKNSLEIKRGITLDELVLSASVLLHDIGRQKAFIKKLNHAEVSAEMANEILYKIKFPINKIEQVKYCIRNHSYMNGTKSMLIKGRILQDADRLDALGVIGLYRTFVYDNSRKLYNQDDPFCRNREPDDKTYTLDHIYKKLLKLDELFNTEKARELAKQRIDFMKYTLTQLKKEL